MRDEVRLAETSDHHAEDVRLLFWRVAADDERAYQRAAGLCGFALWLTLLVPAAIAEHTSIVPAAALGRWTWLLIPAIGLLAWIIDVGLCALRLGWAMLLLALISAVLHLWLLGESFLVLFASGHESIFSSSALWLSFLTCQVAALGLAHAVALSAIISGRFRARARFVSGVLLSTLPAAAGAGVAVVLLTLGLAVFVGVGNLMFPWPFDMDGLLGTYITLAETAVMALGVIPCLVFGLPLVLYSGVVFFNGAPTFFDPAYRPILRRLSPLLVIAPALGLIVGGVWALLHA